MRTTRPPVVDGLSLALQAASSDTSTSTTATIQASYAIAPDFFNGLLVLLSQKVAAVVEMNHVSGEIHFSACEGLRWVCQDQVTRRRGLRRMSRV
jgi:hypothetical protein